MTDLNKEREAFEYWFITTDVYKKISHQIEMCGSGRHQDISTVFQRDDWNEDNYAQVSVMASWLAWQEKAKAQAVPEHIVTLQRNDEVFKFDLLDLLRRSLKSSKVLKTRENWSHVSKMVGLGSTTSTLLCKAMKVDPDGTVFVASESGAEG
ncbi:hypothetical protein APC39_15625 [Acinetobacter pittii]|uniref:hypothetical protein n=1 Tax=Acinetobacter pittii TaxID=48296 RepID=UPI000707245B|nr:hypothetical protein [Acinetobacter pittii]KQG37013.1 hypothetical protein APC39_15625 [Acinetobacter pittii]